MKKLVVFILSLFLVCTPNVQAQLEHKQEILATLGLGGVSFSAALYSSYTNYQKLSEKDAKLKEQGFLNYFSKVYQQAHSSKGLQKHSLPTVGILFSELCFAGSGLNVLKQLLKKDEVEKPEDKKPVVVQRPIVVPVAPVAPNVPPVVLVVPNPQVQPDPQPKLQEKTPEELAIERSLASAQEDENLRMALVASGGVDLVVDPTKGVEEEFSPTVERCFARVVKFPAVLDYPEGLEQGKVKMRFEGVDVQVIQLASLDQHEVLADGTITPGDLCGYYVVANALALYDGKEVMGKRMAREDDFKPFLKNAMKELEKIRNNNIALVGEENCRAIGDLTMLEIYEIEGLIQQFAEGAANRSLFSVSVTIRDFAKNAPHHSEQVYIVNTHVADGGGHWIALKLKKSASGNVTVKVADSMNIIRTKGPGALDKLT